MILHQKYLNLFHKMKNSIKLRKSRKKLFTETIKEANISYLDNPYINEYMDMATSKAMQEADSYPELHSQSRTELTNCAYISIKYNFKNRQWVDSSGFVPTKGDWEGKVNDITYPDEPLMVSSDHISSVYR